MIFLQTHLDCQMPNRPRLGELLVNNGLISQEQLQRALREHKKADLKLGEYLIQQGIVPESKLVELISSQLNIPRFDPHKYPLNMELAHLIPVDTAQQFKLAPISKTGSILQVAMVDPLDIYTLDNIEIMTNLEVEPLICTESELYNLLNALYGESSEDLKIMEGTSETAEEESEEDASFESADVQVSTLRDMAEDAPVIRLVNSLLAQAIREKASDVHLSPEKKYIHLRFRIDGKLQDRPTPPKSMFLPVVSRIKLLANMDIATSRIPQDGRFTINMQGKEVNVRVSSLPTIYGENLVLRLLDMSSEIYSLSQLGMHPEEQKKLENLINKPYGMILSTGPTGSGKTTTLYSILKEINQPDLNIVTLEDPVEYRIAKIRQVQLNQKAGMTFVSGLRSILRQDPDVIMVGEIRDSETARISTQAALTGHRLLSTVHTNDAAGVITRLLDMGMESFLVSSSLLVSVAQRLVRKVCPYCSRPYTPDEKLLAFWGLDKSSQANFKKGKGCYQCHNTGYKGRIGVFEILANDPMVQEMILKKNTAQEIMQAVYQAGKLRTLKEDAEEKVLQGTTTLEEATQAVML